MSIEPKPCGGCGEKDSSKRCMGCLHDFGTPDSAWVQKHHGAPTSPATLQVPDPDVRERVAAIIEEAMVSAWGDICSDTNCHPLDITNNRRKLTFQPRHWSALTGKRAADAILAALPLDGREIATCQDSLQVREATDFYAGQYARACGDRLRARSEVIEECAREAEMQTERTNRDDETDEGVLYGAGYENACADIATAIRKLAGEGGE